MLWKEDKKKSKLLTNILFNYIYGKAIYIFNWYPGSNSRSIYQENSVTKMEAIRSRMWFFSFYGQIRLWIQPSRKYCLCCILIWWMLKKKKNRKKEKYRETLNATRTCKWKSKPTSLLHSTCQFIHLDERRDLLSHRNPSVMYK